MKHKKITRAEVLRKLQCRSYIHYLNFLSEIDGGKQDSFRARGHAYRMQVLQDRIAQLEINGKISNRCIAQLFGKGVRMIEDAEEDTDE